MATLLEKGIIAVKTNQREEAKRLLTQFIKHNPQHEQAWLWLSDAVDTLGDQIQCVEQVLKITPENATAKMALRRLRSQPTRSLSTVPAPSAYPSGMQMVDEMNMVGYGQERRPFRLNQEMMAPPLNQQVHHQPTTMLPPVKADKGYGLLKNTPPQQPYMQESYMQQPYMQPAYPQTFNPSSAQRPQRQGTSAVQTDGVPILPVVLFGTLSVTAVGGIMMIILLIFFS
jgi:hypothetical protein